MTTQSLYGVPIVNMLGLSSSNTITGQALNASNNAIGTRFMAEAGHGAIVGLLALCQSITSPPTYRASLQGNTDRTTPDGTVKGGTTAKVDFVPTAALLTLTFDSPYTPSANEILSAVIAYQTGTIGASNTATFGYRNASVGNIGFPYPLNQNAGTWTASVTGFPVLAPIYNDGYVGRNCIPLSTTTNVIPTSATNPKYYGTAFTPTMNMAFTGAYIIARMPAGSTYNISLFEGTNTTAVSTSGTVNPDVSIGNTSASNPVYVAMPAYTLVAGTVYRLAVSMTTTTGFTTFTQSVFLTQAALQSYFGPLVGCSGSSGTLVWTDYASGSDWRAYHVVPCVDSFAMAAGAVRAVNVRGGADQ